MVCRGLLAVVLTGPFLIPRHIIGDVAPLTHYRRQRPVCQRWATTDRGDLTSPKPLRADARRNRDRLVEVATDAFASDGLAVSLDEIARRAGVGPGTLYRHFPTKEALFEAVVHHRLIELVEHARSLRSASYPGDALFQFVDRLVIEAAPKRDLVDALTSAGVQVGPTVTAAAASLAAEMGHLLQRAQGCGAIRNDIGTAELMALIFGVLVALQPRANQSPDPQLILAIVRDGLRASSGQPLGESDVAL
jgi:AcrR family transcriptional regulator